MTVQLRAAVASVLVFSAAAVAGQDARPLPDQQTLFVATRDNLRRADREQRFFAYKERRTEIRTNPFGKLGTGPTRVYEVTPQPEGGRTRRLLERDGKPVANAETERLGRRNRAARRSGPSAFDDAVAALDFKIERREQQGGASLIVVRFSPRPGAKPQTREGRLAHAFAGTVWVDEDLHEVVRAEGTAVDDIAYGYGIIARLNEGTHVSVTRAQVEPGLWLPVSMRFQGQGRALLIRKLVIDYAVDWFDYRRINLTSERSTSQSAR
jgi:hypothetical protein